MLKGTKVGPRAQTPAPWPNGKDPLSMAKNTALSGIEIRHSKHCASRDEKACDCTPTFQAALWDASTKRRVRKSFKKINDAKAWRRQGLAAIDTRPKSATPRLGEAFDELLVGMRSGRVLNRSGLPYKPATIRSYEYDFNSHARARLGNYRLHEITRRDVQDLVDDLNDAGLSASTLRNKIDPIRVVYRRAIRDDLMVLNPCENLELPAYRPDRKRALGHAEVVRLIAALPDSDQALWATAFYAGLRRGELTALRWSDVNLAGHFIEVRRTWDDEVGEQEPKSRAGKRDVLILPQLAQHLAKHGLATGRDGDAFVFGRDVDLPLARNTVNVHARAAWAEHGLEGVTLHHARHCCISFMVAAGEDLNSVKEYAGHSDIRVTIDTYAHAMPARHSEAADRIGGWLDA